MVLRFPPFRTLLIYRLLYRKNPRYLKTPYVIMLQWELPQVRKRLKRRFRLLDLVTLSIDCRKGSTVMFEKKGLICQGVKSSGLLWQEAYSPYRTAV